MNPLDALASVSGNLGTVNLPVNPVTTALPGAPVSEGFGSMLGGIQSAAPGPMPAVPTLGSSDGPTTWGHLAQQMVLDVNTQQQSAAAKVNDVLAGGPTPVHDAMISTEEANLSFEFLSEVRNKLVDAYQQIMQMQV